MTINELMHNDLLMYGGNLCRFVIRSIDAVVERISDKTTYLPCAIREAEPIPLTEEILKANGFVIERSRECYFIYYSKNDEIVVALEYDVEQKDYWVHLGGYSNVIFKYVHELQHILRLCGLIGLADNFKVK